MENKVCIPIEIIRNSKLSPRARLIWAELSLLPKGVIGEFVVHQKELSLQLGICVSTLRRALKSLEENKLIQFVGLFEKKFKKFVFPALSGHDKKTAAKPAPAPVNEAFAGADMLRNWQALYYSKPSSERAAVTPAEDNSEGLYRLKYSFNNRAPDSYDKSTMDYAKGLYQCFHTKWREQFPLLNGKDNRPLLNFDLIELIVMNQPNIAGEKMLMAIDKDLRRYVDAGV